jgi:Planctomycete cytochrome C
LHPVLIAFALAAAPVSYSRDIAPILAFHCHYCHGNRRQVPAGDLDTRTYEKLMRGGGLGDVVRPGDPERSLLVQFIEGKRGPDKRMPEKAPALSAAEIATIRRWIAEGAKADADTSPRYSMTAPGIKLDAAHPVEIACLVPVKSYVSASVVDGAGKILLTEEGPVANPKGVHDIAAPGEWFRWRIWPEQYWVRTVSVRLVIAYAEKPPAGARLSVKSAAQSVHVEPLGPL